MVLSARQLTWSRADEGQRFLARLIDVEQLRRERAGQNGDKSVESRPQVGAKSGLSRPSQNEQIPEENHAKP